jgi:hypothetical protein
MWEQVGDCFARCDLRHRAAGYVQGLLGDVQRKNSWQLAEQVGLQTPHAFQRLLVRRPPDHVDDPTQRAYYFFAAPLDATLQELAIAAGECWAIETCFQTAKQEVGLDAYEVRSWTGWHLHVTLSMFFERGANTSATAHGKRGVALVPVTEP